MLRDYSNVLHNNSSMYPVFAVLSDSSCLSISDYFFSFLPTVVGFSSFVFLSLTVSGGVVGGVCPSIHQLSHRGGVI